MASIVIPCHGEGANIPGLHKALSEAAMVRPDLDFEFILVDDGSPDDTKHVAHSIALADDRVRLISFSRNFGKEAAMLAGLRAARGDVVVIMDGDGQHPPQLVPEMIDRIERTAAGQVVARRSRRGDPPVRTFLSRLYYRMVNGLMDVQLQDGAGDFRALSRPAADALLELGERNRFSKGLFAWSGFPIEVMEYENVARCGGESSWSFRSLMNYGIDGVISFNDRPLRKLTGVGVGATLVGLVYLVFLLFQWAIHGVEAPGYITTIAVVTVFGGIQLLSITLIGEYIGRIYSEVKARPHYVIESDFTRHEDGS